MGRRRHSRGVIPCRIQPRSVIMSTRNHAFRASPAGATLKTCAGHHAGHAFADYGRIAKTLHLLAMCDPDETYRRTVHARLTVQESRHRLARKIFHGERGALGLVLNAIVLWNTRYSDAALTQLRARGYPADDADSGRLSPPGDHHLTSTAGIPSPRAPAPDSGHCVIRRPPTLMRINPARGTSPRGVSTPGAGQGP
jgi:Tn3 transposase DDE domain